MTTQRLWTRNFILICFCNFFQFLSHNLIATTLAIFIIDLLNGNNQEVGYVNGGFFISALICRPLIGKWLGEFDKKKVLIISFIVFLLPCLLYFVVDNVWLLLILRFIHGFGFGAATTATNTIVADIVPATRKAEGIGYFAMFMSLAVVIGPLSGLAVITRYSFTILFILISITAISGFLCSYFLQPLKDTGNRRPRRQPLHWRQFIDPQTIRIGIVSSLSCNFAFNGLTTFLAVHAKEQGLTMYAGYFFVVYTIVALITRPPVGKIFDRKGPGIVIYPAILFYTAGLVCVGLSDSGSGLLLGGVLTSLGNANLFSCFQTIAVKSVPAERSGVAISTYFILFDCGSVTGSFILAFAAGYLGYSGMYLFSAALVALAGLLYFVFSPKINAPARRQSGQETAVHARE